MIFGLFLTIFKNGFLQTKTKNKNKRKRYSRCPRLLDTRYSA